MSQPLIHQMVTYLWSEIFSADERAYLAGKENSRPVKSVWTVRAVGFVLPQTVRPTAPKTVPLGNGYGSGGLKAA